MSGLRISDQIELPLEAVTSTHGLLAMRGAGKSNAAVVLAEAMYDEHLPWVAIDPKGDWWGVRLGGDEEGLSIPVFGGLHGDIPLEATAGKLLADLVVEHRLTCVLDVSDFSKGDQTRFLVDFAERLFRAKAQERFPLHLFLEEADDYIPQRVMRDQARCVGAWSKIVKQGRNRGLGATLITQRSAVLNKDVLTQLDTLITLRTTSPQDRKAILGWVEHHALGKELVDSLPELQDGEAWLWSPYAYKLMERFRFRRRRTFDSGATPKIGEEDRTPTRLVDIDVDAVREAMAATIEKAKAEDPATLRKRIGALEKELAKRPTEVETITETVVETVEVPVIGDEQIKALTEITTTLREAGDAIVSAMSRFPSVLPKAPPARPPVRMKDVKVTVRPLPERTVAENNGQVTIPQQKVLDALAWLESIGLDGDRLRVGFLAGYSPNSGNFNNILGQLRGVGMVDYPGPGLVSLSEAGRALAAPPEEALTTADVQEKVMGKLKGPQQRVLGEVIRFYPEAITREEIAELVGYSPNSGNFNNILGSLRTLGLIAYPARGLVGAESLLFID